MRRLIVSVSQDHLLRQVKTPRQGLLELVWNAFDAVNPPGVSGDCLV